MEAPLGTSIFQLQKEREFAEANERTLQGKYAENLAKQSRRLTEAEKRPAHIEEPRPGPTHVICAVCREKFEDYYQHVFSARHARAVRDTAAIFSQIDDAITDIADHQAAKQLGEADPPAQESQ